MTSSMLTGEQRRASARRGGLKSLGKIVVPKPINLPSQKLENHGLNPNVEIVPKGTNSWGSRPSSSPSNAWGSATLSPTTDGGSGSPSHLSGRPSSGGSGTRPSSASSDRSHEPTSNVWGPNSRPSSASGALQSNQKSLTSLRPRSAETRPSSSQLSRFAEPSENPVTWGAPETAERLGVRLPKNDGFSLSTGDFPTLGTEKDDAAKNTESQEHNIHSRPGSSSSGLPRAKERSGASSAGDASLNSNVNSGNVNTWRRDNTPYDGFHSNVEQWQGEPQPYQNANMPPQPFGPWHGNPPPGVVWYRGPPSGPPYGPPPPPGGFPMDYPYYHGQIPVNGPNSLPMPPPGPGPRGPHPQTGDMYRPLMPDPYIRPGMPVRPGYYPGPMAYEGYYAPMGHYNPNEREIPFRGISPGPSAYNRYTGQAASDSNKSQAGPGGYGPTGKTSVSEKMDSGHPQDPREQYKVILKHHNGWDGKEEVHKWENTAPSNAPYIEKGDQPRPKSRENTWRPNYKKNDFTDTRREEDYSRVASVPSKRKVEEERVVKESYIDVSASPGILATPKETTLIQKIEGLNAKARASDGKDVTYASGREDQKSSLYAVKPKVIIHPTNEIKGLDTAAINESSLPRKAIHGAQDRVDNRGKGRFNKQEADGWQKKPIAAVAPSAVPGLNSETINAHLQDLHISEVVTEKCGSYLEEKDDDVSGTSMSDPSDILAQRAKMREIAKQRAKELQKEEEERTRDQKAKARAKLEELNRRTQAVELTQKLDNPPHDESTITTTSTVKTPTSVLVSNTNIAAQNSEMCSIRVGEFDTMSPIEAPKNTCQVSIVTQNQSLPLQQGVDYAVSTEMTPQHHDSSAPKQKRTSYKQKLKLEAEKSSIEKNYTVNANEAPKTDNEVANNVDVSAEVANVKISELSSSIESNSIPEPTVNQKRKNYNRNNKSKHKQEETTSSLLAIPSHVPKDVNIAKVAIDTVENNKANLSEWDLPMPVEPITRSKDEIQFSEHQISVQSDESHGRVNNQWKSHNPRRLPRNQQVHRAVDKFHGGGDAVIWAPVRSQSKVEVNNEDATLTTMSDNPVQNNLKNKRAEMERYVPKPVSKELTQQGGAVSSGNQVSSDETVERVEAEKIESSTISKSGDFKQNKQTKAVHGSWKQRGSSESTRVQDGSTYSSKPNYNMQQPVEDTHFKKHDVHSVKVQAKLSDEWNNPDNLDSASSIPPSVVVKDQILHARAKRQPYKGNRNTGNYSNYEIDHKNTSIANKDKVYSQSSVQETNERPISQWQPKSQAYSHDQKSSRPIIQTGYNEAAKFGKESVPKSGVHPSSGNVTRDGTNESHIDHLVPKTVREAPKLGNQNTRKGEKKVPVVEYTPNEDMGSQNEQQRFSSGFRRNGNQNNRFGTGHESQREWSSSGDGQDNKQQRQPVIRDRQRHNSEYEQKSNNFEGPGDGPSRFRDRGPTQSRRGRGGFYGRQSDNVGVDAAYD